MVKKSEEISSSAEIWQKESPIPNEAQLYCYIHKSNIRERKPIELAFRNTPFIGGKDLSSDWNKYSTPELTRSRLALQQKGSGKGNKNPDDYFIVKLSVNDILTKIPDQLTEHDPIQNHQILPDNRAHSKIIGEKEPEIRLKFVDIAKWAISPE